MKTHKTWTLLIVLSMLYNSNVGLAQAPIAGTKTTSSTAAPPPSGSNEAPVFKQEELDQLVAPIALYPDSLIAQILMASTYPLEIVQADRWVSQNKLEGDALAGALDNQPWDPSVKSLVNFPQVLSMMSEKLDWTTNLGDAFLAQQKPVMDAIQKLRKKAKENGNLESNEQQKVIVEPLPPPPPGDTTTTTTTVTETYIIESANPQVIYVPTYNPTVVYGAWPYPAYPPYSYYPPGYVAGTAALSFGLGVAAGAAWGNAWGNCNWGHGDVDIDVRGGNSFNRTNINNSRNASNVGNRNNNVQGGRNSWQHDPSHRKGASYRDQNTANKFGGASTREAAQARDSFRGRADSGRQDIARGGADQFKGRQGPSAGTMDQRGSKSAIGGGRDQPGQGPSAGTRDQTNRGGAGNRSQTADRSPSSASQNRPSQNNRPSPSQGNRGGAFDSGSGKQARSESQRGQSSRSNSAGHSGGSRPSSGGGASRGGGGGGRSGGGGRGGRR